MQKASPPPLLPLLRSRLQAEILTLVLLGPEEEWSLTGLATRTGASVSSVQREITRAEQAGVVRSRRLGNVRLVKAADSPLTAPLTELLLRSFGPRQVLAEELEGVEGVQGAYLFGSWAARYAGEAGPPAGRPGRPRDRHPGPGRTRRRRPAGRGPTGPRGQRHDPVAGVVAGGDRRLPRRRHPAPAGPPLQCRGSGMSWETGSERIRELINAGELGQVPPDAELARRMLADPGGTSPRRQRPNRPETCQVPTSWRTTRYARARQASLKPKGSGHQPRRAHRAPGRGHRPVRIQHPGASLIQQDPARTQQLRVPQHRDPRPFRRRREGRDPGRP